MSKSVLMPDESHPITIERHPGRVTISAAGRTVARTDAALTLREAKLPPVHYIPRADVDMPLLTRSEHHTHCPYKGDASYYNVPALGDQGPNAVWTYEHPHPSVAEIKGHLAFYPDRVEIEEK